MLDKAIVAWLKEQHGIEADGVFSDTVPMSARESARRVRVSLDSVGLDPERYHGEIVYSTLVRIEPASGTGGVSAASDGEYRALVGYTARRLIGNPSLLERPELGADVPRPSGQGTRPRTVEVIDGESAAATVAFAAGQILEGAVVLRIETLFDPQRP